MKDLEDILTAITKGVNDIETLVRNFPLLDTDIEYGGIPLKLKDKNLLVRLQVGRVTDNTSIFSYCIVLCLDLDDQLTIQDMAYETIDGQEQFEEFEHCAAVIFDSQPTLEAVFTPDELTPYGIACDFWEKFNSITKNEYAITNNT